MDHPDAILSLLFHEATLPPGDRNFIHLLRSRIRPEHLPSGPARVLLQAVYQYYRLTSGGTPTISQVRALIQADHGLHPDRALPLLAKLDQLQGLLPSGADRPSALLAIELLLRDHFQAQLYSTLADTAEILRPDGRAIRDPRTGHTTHLLGPLDALRYLRSQILPLDPASLPSLSQSTTSSADGDVRQEIGDIAREYALSSSGHAPTIRTAIAPIDGIAGGLDRGDLFLIAGYIGEGKSILMLNIAHAALLQGKTVAYLTSETSRRVTRRRLLCRHSCLPSFPAPISYTDFRRGALSDSDQQTLASVLQDLAQNPAYGHFYCWQLPTSVTWSSLLAKAEEYDNLSPTGLDLICIDSLHLVGAEDGPSTGSRTAVDTWALRSIVIDAKRTATGFADGRGVTIISPWHVSRNSWETAKNSNGVYPKGSLGLTSEADKSADLILSIYRTPEDLSTLRASFQKCREEDEGSPFNLHARFDHSFIGSDELAVPLADTSGFFAPSF